jgi:membrane-bound serine protease (ClpP class)
MLQRLTVIAIAGSILGAGARQPAQVALIRIDGAIGPATANYIARAIDVAAAARDECLVIQLDTPGGLLESTKQIVQTFYAAKVPVVVYVAPSGAVAGSAGVFVTLAADIAAMAPNTTIGAAHPVEISTSGGAQPTDDVMKTKLENYASSFIESIANRRHRNVEWARSAVLQSIATTAEKALDLKVIDLIANDLPQLLQRVDGRTVGERTLHTANATVVEIPMSAGEHLFQLIWRPEVMFLLMLVAMYGIIGELSSPGAILPGVAGAIAVILFLFMSATLPVSVAGLALMGLALALFIIDAFAPTHGVLTVGGILAFFLGALLLFSDAGPGFRLSLAWIIPATVTTAAFFMFGVAKGIQAQFQPVRVGKETLFGRAVTAGSRIDARGGTVFTEGERWNAVSDTPVEMGDAVEVIAIDGLTLQVKPKAQHVGES